MRSICTAIACLGLSALLPQQSQAQISLLQDYKNNTSAPIGTFQGINFREGGFSSLFPIPGTDGKEFWTCSDRGVNIDDASANPAACRPTYDKMFVFPSYAPKIHRVRISGDSVRILQTISIKRPSSTAAAGVLSPTGLGSTAAEVASTDTVQNCANFNTKTTPKDTFSIDSEGILVDKDGFFYLSEENGPTIWKLNRNGVLIKRYTPYANLPGVQPVDVAIDTVFKYRKNNRGFESIAIAPNGKLYAAIQSPLLYPNTSTGENTRIHRILEIDPVTNATRMFAYLNDGIIGASGANQIRLRDWKLGDMAAINDTTFLIIEAAARGTTDVKKIYKINIAQATPVSGGLYNGLTLEALVDSAGLANNGVVPVQKTLAVDLLANGWPSALDKSEGIAILNDSTIAVCNDNDYGQTSPAANGVATATGTVSHILTFRLLGPNRLNNYVPTAPTISQGATAQSSSTTPYLVPTVPSVRYTAILSAGDVVNGYKMAGTPDGLGLYDNNDGSFTLLMNHEFASNVGATHAHGSTGSFVSKWVIRKSDYTVLSGGDLIQNINLWNPSTSSYINYNSSFPSTSAALGRFCSADLPEVGAYYNSLTGMGTRERIFMNGEETGNEGRAFAHIATGPAAGTSYELPRLGKFSRENSLAYNGNTDSTVVIGTDDQTPGQVYVYVGYKTNSGSDVERAGLTNGKLFGISVSGMLTETNATIPTPGTAFSLIDLGNVSNTTGAALQTLSDNKGVTSFLRPEDAAWDPVNKNDLYFNTTNALTSPSRLWKLHFTNPANPTLGGTITAVLDGTEGQKMLDNITIDNSGHALLVEDVGNNVHLGRVLQYNINTDSLNTVGVHDSTRFLSNGANYLTQDEEASGIVDAQKVLGPGMFLTVVQAHYSIPGDVVEGGQLLVFNNPESAAGNPEIAVKGNSIMINDGDVTPDTTDRTQFGNVNIGTTLDRSFEIVNGGPGTLVVNELSLNGSNTFSLVNAPALPIRIAAGATQSVTVRYAPNALQANQATLNIGNNDLDEDAYDFALAGTGVAPEIGVSGNGVQIADGDLTPGGNNNTDFGTTGIGDSVIHSFAIANTGSGSLRLDSIAFTGTDASDFTVADAVTYPLEIASGATRSVRVKFAPRASGQRNAVINVYSNDSDEGLYDIALQGRGALPVITVLGDTTVIIDGDLTPGVNNRTDYGNVGVGTTRSQNFKIRNTGRSPLVVSRIDLGGPQASEFALSGVSFPLTVAPDSMRSFTCTFAPTAPGARDAVVNVISNDSNTVVYDFAIRGTGTVPSIQVLGDSVVISNNDTTPSTLDRTDFGMVTVGSNRTLRYKIRNTGLSQLVVNRIELSGPQTADFRLTGVNFPLTVGPDSTQTFDIVFAPAAAGLSVDTVTVVNNDSSRRQYKYVVQGTGVTTTGITSSKDDAAQVKLFPNPVSGLATLEVSAIRNERAELEIVDVSGKRLLSQQLDLKAGTNQFPVQASGLASGIYFVNLRSASLQAKVRIVVTH